MSVRRCSLVHTASLLGSNVAAVEGLDPDPLFCLEGSRAVSRQPADAQSFFHKVGLWMQWQLALSWGYGVT